MFRLTARKLLAAASALILAATLNPVSSATAAGGLVVTFEQNDTSGYVNIDFDDAPMQQASSVVSDAPDNAGRALKVIRGKASWAGTTIIKDPSKVLLKTGELFVSARVHSPKANIVIRMKIEKAGDPTQSVETNATEKSKLGWHTYTFDFSKQATGTEAFSVNKTYSMASMFFDFVQLGPQVTTGNQVFYVDDKPLLPLLAEVGESSRLARLPRQPCSPLMRATPREHWLRLSRRPSIHKVSSVAEPQSSRLPRLAATAATFWPSLNSASRGRALTQSSISPEPSVTPAARFRV